ncbi:MAG: exodeoxyribonuclease VII small subunit [Verrucomicrobiota bacterium]
MAKGNSEEDMTFEEGLEKLEALVEQMESGDLPLDDLIKRYEQGSKLLKTCQARIKEAEKKIEILRNKNADNPDLENFDPDT